MQTLVDLCCQGLDPPTSHGARVPDSFARVKDGQTVTIVFASRTLRGAEFRLRGDGGGPMPGCPEKFVVLSSSSMGLPIPEKTDSFPIRGCFFGPLDFLELERAAREKLLTDVCREEEVVSSVLRIALDWNGRPQDKLLTDVPREEEIGTSKVSFDVIGVKTT
ncbi:hypothetical protein NDU88_012516 [Pleurodeles waltl]|uniref:Uncharacterized protein n=1 Tax=Pleurodeles waltl TaxID=8319 RepID=A0AAV7R0X0_PLEWA|nr:hypothetical protein NDU88_012516 [Pleurodeles waltl]